jgi:nucleotide-binding universal stress UspA family protein
MRILLAVDGSKFSDAATDAVIAQAIPGKAEVRVVHVVDTMDNPFPAMTAFDAEIEHAPNVQRKPAEALVEATAELLRAKGLKATTAVEWGDPKSKIIDAAQQWHADLIVIGSHGRTGLERFMMGSVSDAVARHAPCSVEVVRIPKS